MASYNKKRKHFDEEENNVRVKDRTCCGVSYLRNLLHIYNIFLFVSFNLLELKSLSSNIIK